MARTFNGTSDQVNFGAADVVDNLSPWTAMAYVRRTGDIVDERQVFDKMDSGFQGTMFICAAGDGVDNNTIFTLRSGNSSAYAGSANNLLLLNTWTVVVTTFDGGVGGTHYPQIFSCAVGGTMTETTYSSQTSGSGFASDASANLRLATRDPLDATFFAGGLCECALWNRVLNSTELNMLGLGYSALWIPSGLQFYSPVSGASSPEADLSGNGNTGTVSGTSFLAHPPVIYTLDSQENPTNVMVYS